jgi:Lrp/AsnC family transcriptional regulator, leucine-responsive regulatory protein
MDDVLVLSKVENRTKIQQILKNLEQKYRIGVFCRIKAFQVMEKIPQTEKPANEPIVLDEKDKAILRLLQENAKITVREIAAQVHLSTTPVHERIRRLEDTGVICQYAALLDHSKVKKGLLAICYVSLKEHNKKSGARFIRTIQQMPEIMECFIISGEFDFLLKVAVENMDAYYDFHVNQLGQVENIGHVQSTFVMGVVKQSHQLIS